MKKKKKKNKTIKIILIVACILVILLVLSMVIFKWRISGITFYRITEGECNSAMVYEEETNGLNEKGECINSGYYIDNNRVNINIGSINCANDIEIVKLKVDKNYLVPILESGIVVFIGDKEGYGKTIIIEQTDGVNAWYGNVDNINVSLYDYVSKGEFLAEANEKLYMVFQKNGKYLKYTDYLK